MSDHPSFVRCRPKATWGRSAKALLIAAIVALIAGSAAAQGRGGKGQPRREKLDPAISRLAQKVAGETAVIIEFNSEMDAEKIIKANGGKAGRRLGILKARVGRVPNAMLKRLANHPAVKRISVDRPVQGLIGRTAVTVGARAVQELMGYSGAGVGVAIIDSGVTPWHDDLTQADGQGQRVAHFVDFVNGQTQPYDDWGHGTHVAGIVGGNGYDAAGIRTAIAPRANIIALKALDANGNGTISGIIAAIDYAVANKDALNIRVINMSLGAGVYESYNSDPLTLAAKRAVDAGIVVVAAAGNLGKAANGQPQYGAITAPGNAPWVITVGASSTNGTVLRQDDTIAPYSSRGPTMIDYIAKPDLVAPGTGTVALSAPGSTFFTSKAQYLLPGLISTSNPTPYLVLSGTSMAAPVVAGAVALMLEANPGLTPNLVKAMLQFSAQEYPGYNALTQGAGFLNARGAVQLAEYFQRAQRGSLYPSMNGWSRHVLWGNRRISGGVLTPGGTAWDENIVWGASATPEGDNIVWGENCLSDGCDNIVWGSNVVWGESADDDNIVWGSSDGENIVWGSTDDDNIVWGSSDDENIVWGSSDDENIVWGSSDDENIVWGSNCGGEDCDNIVWGSSADSEYENIVWGSADDGENIVWGSSDDDNIVWGSADDAENIVWGSTGDENIVWGSSVAEVAAYLDESAQVLSLPSSMWDVMFPLDATWPVVTTPAEEAPPTNEAPPTEEAPPTDEAPPTEEAPPTDEPAPAGQPATEPELVLIEEPVAVDESVLVIEPVTATEPVLVTSTEGMEGGLQ